MTDNLYWNTTSELLRSILLKLSDQEIFNGFRLVGGTALSLQIGHRKSDDIDLFTDQYYGSVDFYIIDSFLRRTFKYVSSPSQPLSNIGRSYFIGDSRFNAVKLDLYHTDTFIWPTLQVNKCKLASLEEIIAMKLEIFQDRGRKKDFWDIHALSNKFTFNQMLNFHQQRYPYSHNVELIRKNILDFEKADDDLSPKCIRGLNWELIKIDLIIFVKIEQPSSS
ncbi:MAG: nucleotidyl transferase AbiEii/AbiGii toxin family protein [Bacteroidetes bacterium]|nr:nucleotidyl transferase AbiEii/AbiGii toxin family protein [Bacteroidota bacterium]